MIPLFPQQKSRPWYNEWTHEVKKSFCQSQRKTKERKLENLCATKKGFNTLKVYVYLNLPFKHLLHGTERWKLLLKLFILLLLFQICYHGNTFFLYFVSGLVNTQISPVQYPSIKWGKNILILSHMVVSFHILK